MTYAASARWISSNIVAALVSAMMVLASGCCAACAPGAGEPQAPRALEAKPATLERPAAEQDPLKQDKCNSLHVPRGGKLLVNVRLNVPKAEDARTEAARSALLTKLPKEDAVTARTYMNSVELTVSEVGLAVLCADPMAEVVRPVEIHQTQ